MSYSLRHPLIGHCTLCPSLICCRRCFTSVVSSLLLTRHNGTEHFSCWSSLIICRRLAFLLWSLLMCVFRPQIELHLFGHLAKQQGNLIFGRLEWIRQLLHIQSYTVWVGVADFASIHCITFKLKHNIKWKFLCYQRQCTNTSMKVIPTHNWLKVNAMQNVYTAVPTVPQFHQIVCCFVGLGFFCNMLHYAKIASVM